MSLGLDPRTRSAQILIWNQTISTALAKQWGLEVTGVWGMVRGRFSLIILVQHHYDCEDSIFVLNDWALIPI